jgi:beta-galactosidase
MGVKIHHVDALRPGLHESIHMNGQDYTYSTWADILTPDGAEVVATFSTDAYEGAAAICQHSVGAGTCVTIGAWVEASTLRELLLPHLAEVATINLPDGVRITQRGGHTYLYNYNPNEVSLADVNLPGAPQTIDKHEVVMLPDDDASQVRRQHVPATTSS